MTPEQEALVEQYQGYAIATGRRVCKRSHTAMWDGDLDSAALEGLMRAVRTFDPSGGASFHTWLGLKVRGAVLDELRRVLRWGPRGTGYQPRPIDLTPGQMDLVDSTGLGPVARETADSGDTGDRRVAEIIDLVEVRGRRAMARRRWIASEVWVNGRTMLDVATEIGVTESRVCQILNGVRAELAVKLAQEAA